MVHDLAVTFLCRKWTRLKIKLFPIILSTKLDDVAFQKLQPSDTQDSVIPFPVILPAPGMANLMSQYERARIQTLLAEKMKTHGLHACFETIPAC